MESRRRQRGGRDGISVPELESEGVDFEGERELDGQAREIHLLFPEDRGFLGWDDESSNEELRGVSAFGLELNRT